MNKKIKLIICALISAVILFFVGLIIGFAAYNIFSVNNTQNTTDSASTNSISSTQQTTNVSNVDNVNTDNTPSKNIVSNKTYNPNATINSNEQANKIPHAGINRTYIIVIVLIITCAIGIYSFNKYRQMKYL